MNKQKLELMIMATCPFCQRVLNYLLTRKDLEIGIRDINEDPDAKIKLETIGGKKQVPCLFVDDKPMYESMDIIEFLKTL